MFVNMRDVQIAQERYNDYRRKAQQHGKMRQAMGKTRGQSEFRNTIAGWMRQFRLLGGMRPASATGSSH
jgi:hypothetical protein